MEGLIEIGKLKRIQAVLNQFVRNKISNVDVQFDWNTNLQFIKKGKGPFLPVTINSDFKIEMTKNLYYERFIIENQLKAHFLKDYNL
jgi:hypothetical protein